MAIKRLTTSDQRARMKKIKESFIHNLTEEQVDNYIDNQVTDLASAKAFLKKLSKIVLHLLKK